MQLHTALSLNAAERFGQGCRALRHSCTGASQPQMGECQPREVHWWRGNLCKGCCFSNYVHRLFFFQQICCGLKQNYSFRTQLPFSWQIKCKYACCIYVPVVGGNPKEQLSNLLDGSSVSSKTVVSCVRPNPECPFKLTSISLVPSIPYSCQNYPESIQQMRVGLADVIRRIILMPIKTINFIWNMTEMKCRVTFQACACISTHTQLTSVHLPLLFDLLGFSCVSFSLFAFQRSATSHGCTFQSQASLVLLLSLGVRGSTGSGLTV